VLLSQSGQLTPTPGLEPRRDPVNVTVGLGKGEIEVGLTSEGAPFATVTAAPVGGSLGISVGNSNPPGFEQSRAVARGPASVVTFSGVGKAGFVLGPVGVEASLNIGINFVNVLTPTDAFTVPVIFVDPSFGGSLTGNTAAGFRGTGLLGFEAGAFRLR